MSESLLIHTSDNLIHAAIESQKHKQALTSLAIYPSACTNMESTTKYVYLLWKLSRFCSQEIQILALTTDNASNNMTLVNELADLLPGFQGSLAWIRCFAHVLNLVVKVRENLIIFPLILLIHPLGYSITIQPHEKGYGQW